jgi:hypothetical protein
LFVFDFATCASHFLLDSRDELSLPAGAVGPHVAHPQHSLVQCPTACFSSTLLSSSVIEGATGLVHIMKHETGSADQQGLVPATPLGRDRAFQYQVNSARFLSTSGGSNGDDDNDEKKKKSNEEDSEEAKDEKEDKEKESGDEEDTPAGTLEIVSVSHDEPGEVTLGASTRGPNFSPALKRVPVCSEHWT